jgi:hypothetical protein
MHNELAYVPEDGAALRWACGCAIVALTDRARAMKRAVDTPALRMLASALLAFKAFDAIFATALTLTYRSGAVHLLEPLGRLTAGGDYTRLIPLIEAVPDWLHALTVLAGTSYACALLGLWRRSPATFTLAATGTALELTTWHLGRSVEAASGVVANPSPSWLVAALPVAVLLAAFAQSARYDEREQLA